MIISVCYVKYRSTPLLRHKSDGSPLRENFGNTLEMYQILVVWAWPRAAFPVKTNQLALAVKIVTVVFWLNTPKYSLKVQQNTNVRFQHPSGSNPQILPPKSTPTACNFYRGVPTMVYKVSFFRKFYLSSRSTCFNLVMFLS